MTMTTPDTDPIAQLEEVRLRRAELQTAKRLRTQGEVGFSDVCAAEYRLGLAVQRARDAGLLARPTADQQVPQ